MLRFSSMTRYQRRLTLKIIGIAGVLILALVVYSRQAGRQRKKTFIQAFPGREFSRNEVKKILYWGPQNGLAKGISKDARRCMKTCDAKCEISDNYNDVKELETSDAVYILLMEFWSENWRFATRKTYEFPKIRYPHQVWIAGNLEPPGMMFGDLTVFNNKFNWTHWYRRDATVNFLYGSYGWLTSNEQLEAIEKWRNVNNYREKTKFITALISNCYDYARRYVTINEMGKYLDEGSMDLFGKCYSGPCGKSGIAIEDVCVKTLKQYRFYLAFESCYCKDYVTEKYWYALDRGNLPIVNWKTVTPSLVVPHSYINVFDFKDIKSAVNYIKKVNNNETLYNSYFEWRKKYWTGAPCPACSVCRALYDKTIPAQVYRDLDSWVQHDTCEKINTFVEIKRHTDVWMYRIFGI